MFGLVPIRAAETPVAPRFWWNPAGEAYLGWDSVPGYQDQLWESGDLLSWSALGGPYYGLGQLSQVRIEAADHVGSSGGGGGNGGAGGVSASMYHHFIITKYPGPLFVASWPSTTGGTLHASLDPEIWEDLPCPWLKIEANLSTNPTYGVMIFANAASSSATAPAASTLQAPDAAVFARLTALAPAFAADFSEASGTTIQGPPPPPGPKHFFKVIRKTLDSDEDGLPDHDEFAWNSSSPFDHDTDHDGIVDLKEDFDGDGVVNYAEMAQAWPPQTAVQSGYGPELITVSLGGFDYKVLRFRCLPGIAHGYSYQVQESTNLWDWTDLNHYTNIVGSPISAGDGSGAELVTIHSSVMATATPHRFLRLKVFAPWPGYELVHQAVTPETLKAHSDAHFTDLIPNNTFSRHIFDNYNRETDCTWARWSWTNNIDFTGVAWDDYWPGGSPAMSMTEGMLISPRHIIMSRHTLPYGGRGLSDGSAGTIQTPSQYTRFVFHKRDGTREVRSLQKYVNGPNDISIGLLNEAVPDGIRIYKLLPPRRTDGSVIDWGALMGQARLILTSRERDCRLYNLDRIEGPWAYRGIDQSVPLAYRFEAGEGFAQDSARTGTSGNPWFIFFKGEPVLWAMFTSPGAGPFFSSPTNFDSIQGMMAQLLPGYSIQTVQFN